MNTEPELRRQVPFWARPELPAPLLAFAGLFAAVSPEIPVGLCFSCVCRKCRAQLGLMSIDSLAEYHGCWGCQDGAVFL